VGGAVKGEYEVSSDGKTKVDVKAEVGGNIGSLKLPGGKIEQVTKNEQGQSELPKMSRTDAGLSREKAKQPLGTAEALRNPLRRVSSHRPHRLR